jgi:hypothetical protein
MAICKCAKVARKEAKANPKRALARRCDRPCDALLDAGRSDAEHPAASDDEKISKNARRKDHKALPPPATDWRTTDADEILKRQLRAREERHSIANLDARHPIFSNFGVRSPRGMTYQVEIRDLVSRQLTLPQTKGRFRLNSELSIAFDGRGKMEVDLFCADARLAIELDGAQHLADAEAYRRDRRKDALLQQHGCFVLRFLAEDAGKRLDHVLDAIVAALAHRSGYP